MFRGKCSSSSLMLCSPPCYCPSQSATSRPPPYLHCAWRSGPQAARRDRPYQEVRCLLNADLSIHRSDPYLEPRNRRSSTRLRPQASSRSAGIYASISKMFTGFPRLSLPSTTSHFLIWERRITCTNILRSLSSMSCLCFSPTYPD